jgi:DNA-binding MarR family transcriptional regulator
VNEDGSLVRVPEYFLDEFPAADPLAADCAMNVMRLADLMLRELSKFFQRYHLTPASAHVVGILEGAEEPLSPHQIAEQLYIATSTMTTLIDTAERRGLVRRVPHPSDRRKILVEITNAGRAVVHEASPYVHAIEKQMFAPLSDEQKQQLLNLLEPVIERVQAGNWDLDDVPPRNKEMRYSSNRAAEEPLEAHAEGHSGKEERS